MGVTLRLRAREVLAFDGPGERRRVREGLGLERRKPKRLTSDSLL